MPKLLSILTQLKPGSWEVRGGNQGGQSVAGMYPCTCLRDFATACVAAIPSMHECLYVYVSTWTWLLQPTFLKFGIRKALPSFGQIDHQNKEEMECYGYSLGECVGDREPSGQRLLGSALMVGLKKMERSGLQPHWQTFPRVIEQFAT